MDEDSLLDPDFFDDLPDLEMALLAQLFRQARVPIRSLHDDLSYHLEFENWRELVPPEIRDFFVSIAEEFLPLCEKLVNDLDPAACRCNQFLAQRAEARAAQQVFVDHIAAHTTYVGSDNPPQASCQIGWIDNDPNRYVAASCDSGYLALIAGVQKSGKNILSTVLTEGCLRARPPLTSQKVLPTASVFFHLEQHDRLPQLLAGLAPNPTPRDLEILQKRLGLSGAGIERINLAVPELLLKGLGDRLDPYKELGLNVLPLRVHLGQLGLPALEGALGGDPGSRHIRRMLEDAQRQGENLEITKWHDFIDEATDLTSWMKRTAHARLSLLEQIASPLDRPGIWDLVEPGVATVMFLGGSNMSHGDTVPLVVGLLHGVMMVSVKHGPFQRLIIVDEVNLCDLDATAWGAFTRAGRMVRHQGSTLVLMGQDLLRVPNELFGLASMVAVGKLRNPLVWDDIRARVGALRGWRYEDVADFEPGEFLLAVSESTDPNWRGRARRIKVRPPLCLHGGFTRGMI